MPREEVSECQLGLFDASLCRREGCGILASHTDATDEGFGHGAWYV